MADNDFLSIGIPHEMDTDGFGCASLNSNLEVPHHLDASTVVVERSHLTSSLVIFDQFRVARRKRVSENLARLSVTLTSCPNTIVILDAKFS
jgi:hypothetical protein